jgi:hypothetical protein
MPEHVQPPTLVIPQPVAGFPQLGTETLTITDAAVHSSLYLPTAYIRQKTAYLYLVNFGAPPLQFQMNTGPTPVAAAMTALGLPTTYAVTASDVLMWTTQSTWCRLDVQCPLWAGVGAWVVQVVFEGASQ